MKILVIRLSGISEIILSTPVVRNLKTQVDQAEVHYCTESSYYPLLEANPYIDKIHLLGDNMSKLIKELQSENFDHVIDLQGSLQTSLVKYRLGKPSKTYKNLKWEKWLMVNLKINKLPGVHLVDRFMETVKDLDVKMDSLGLDYFIPEREGIDLESLPHLFRKEFVVFAIGAAHGTKRLPLSKMIELCDKINKPVILMGNREDHETGEKLMSFFEKDEISRPFEEGLKELNKKTVIYNACGMFSLHEQALLIRQSRYVFTHDNEIMHIAAAFRKRIFSIWGSSIPRFGMYPYRTQFTIFENTRIDCRPCSATGRNTCPKGHFKCMKNLTFDFYLP